MRNYCFPVLRNEPDNGFTTSSSSQLFSYVFIFLNIMSFLIFLRKKNGKLMGRWRSRQSSSWDISLEENNGQTNHAEKSQYLWYTGISWTRQIAKLADYYYMEYLIICWQQFQIPFWSCCNAAVTTSQITRDLTFAKNYSIIKLINSDRALGGLFHCIQTRHPLCKLIFQIRK